MTNKRTDRSKENAKVIKWDSSRLWYLGILSRNRGLVTARKFPLMIKNI